MSFLLKLLGFGPKPEGPNTRVIILVGIIVLGSGYVISSLAKLIKSVDDIDDSSDDKHSHK